MLERKLPEMDLRVLVELPAGLDYNEWLASHSKSYKNFQMEKAAFLFFLSNRF